MSYRPDPTFNDSLEPDVPLSARETIGLTVAAVLSLSFALAVSLFVLIRAAVRLPGKRLRKSRRR